MTSITEYFTDPERPEFVNFGKKMEKALVLRCGFGVLDLPDQDYSSLFEDWDGTDEMIGEMADEILEEEGMYYDMD